MTEPAIIWRNANNGDVAAWFMSSFTWSSVALFGNPGGDVALSGFGDFTGDGRADLLLFNTSNSVVGYWRSNGAQEPSAVSLARVSGWRFNWAMTIIGKFSSLAKALIPADISDISNCRLS